jgi:tape measure domain-containing protein
MAESFSVRASLSAIDKGFTSTIKGAIGSVTALGDKIKNGFAFGVLTGMGQQAFSAISGGFKSLVGEAVSASDSMQKLQQAMRFDGASESEIKRIAGSTGTLKTYADKTVFSLNDVMSTFGALSANGIKDADKMTESIGNAVAVYGGGAKEFSSAALAFSQSMAAGKMNAQDWNQVINASPQLAGGLRKELVKLNPVLEKDFKGAMEDGAITADLLGQALNNIGMTEAAKKAATSVTTWEGAMGNLEAAVQSGIMGLYDSFAKSGLINVINGFTEKIGAGFDWLSTNIPKAIDKIKPYVSAFKTAFSGVGPAFGEAFGAVKSALGELMGAFGSTQSVDGFKGTMQSLADFLKGVAGFIKEHASEIAQLITMLPKIVVGIKAFSIAKAVLPGVVGFAKGIAGLAGKGIGGIASKLFGIAGGTKAAGAASATSATQMVASAKSFMMMGAAVFLIASGFALLAFSAISLAAAGGPAIAVMAGLVIALAALGVGLAFMLQFLSTLGPTATQGAAAMLIMAAAVLVISVAFALLAATAIALANSGGAAIAVMAASDCACWPYGVGGCSWPGIDRRCGRIYSFWRCNSPGWYGRSFGCGCFGGCICCSACYCRIRPARRFGYYSTRR